MSDKELEEYINKIEPNLDRITEYMINNLTTKKRK